MSTTVRSVNPVASGELAVAAASNGKVDVDGRFSTKLGVNHTDSKGRQGSYVDQQGSFQAIPGANGKPQAVAYTAGLAVDTDGSGSAHGDKSHQRQTQLELQGHDPMYPDADTLPYVAIPPSVTKAAKLTPGDIVQVTAPNGNTAFAIYADTNDSDPGRKLGEGSPALLRALGYNDAKTVNPNTGGLASGVKYVAFPGSGAQLGTVKNGFPNTAQVQAFGQQAVARVNGGAAPKPVADVKVAAKDTMGVPAKQAPVDLNPSQSQAPVHYKAAPSFARVAEGGVSLKLGTEGDSVKQMQQMLGMKGKDVDGLFGPHTEKAVMQFQQAHGLAVDGKMGQETLAALKQAMAAGKTTAAPAATPSVKPETKPGTAPDTKTGDTKTGDTKTGDTTTAKAGSPFELTPSQRQKADALLKVAKRDVPGQVFGCLGLVHQYVDTLHGQGTDYGNSRFRNEILTSNVAAEVAEKINANPNGAAAYGLRRLDTADAKNPITSTNDPRLKDPKFKGAIIVVAAADENSRGNTGTSVNADWVHGRNGHSAHPSWKNHPNWPGDISVLTGTTDANGNIQGINDHNQKYKPQGRVLGIYAPQ